LDLTRFAYKCHHLYQIFNFIYILIEKSLIRTNIIFLHFDGESRIINQTENLIRIPDKTLKTPENSRLTRFDCSMRGYLKY